MTQQERIADLISKGWTSDKDYEWILHKDGKTIAVNISGQVEFW